jgi:hypothetical protein
VLRISCLNKQGSCKRTCVELLFAKLYYESTLLLRVVKVLEKLPVQVSLKNCFHCYYDLNFNNTTGNVFSYHLQKFPASCFYLVLCKSIQTILCTTQMGPRVYCWSYLMIKKMNRKVNWE